MALSYNEFSPGTPSELIILRKYKKQDAPRWQRRLVIILSGLFAATVLLFAAWAVILFLDTA